MATNYLQSLLKKRLGAGYDYSAPSYDNEYDNGSVWDLPDAPEMQQQSTNDYDSMLKKLMPDVYGDYASKYTQQNRQAQVQQEIDPLQAPRNQVDYYTKQLEQAGATPEAPSTLSKVGSGALKALEGVTLVPASILNTISGAANSLVKAQDKSLGSKSVGDIINDIGESVDQGLKSGGATYKAFLNEDERKNVKTFSDTFQSMMDSKNGVLKRAGEIITQDANPVYNIAMANGVDDKTATEYGKMGADVLVNLAIPTPDKIGKALKYMQGADKIKDAEKIGGDLVQATKLAKQSNSIDDYEKIFKNANPNVEYTANDLQKSYDTYINNIAQKNVQQTTKALGGMTDFQGITLGDRVILSRDALDKLASNKVTNALTQTGLGLYSPVSAFMNNPIVDTVGAKLGDTKIGNAVKETVQDKFVNPYKTAMRNDPENALKYGNSMIKSKTGEKMLRENIASGIDEVKQFSEQADQTPQNITKTVEDVKTRYNETETPMQVINDEYANQAKKYAYRDYKGLSEDVSKQQSNLDTQIAEAKAKGIDTTDLDKQRTELTKVNEDLTKAQETAGTNFSKSVKEDANLSHLDDKQISSLMDDSLKNNTTTLKEKLIKDYGVDEEYAHDTAIALRKNANGVLDEVDKQYPGMSKYFSGLKQENLGETFKDAKNASTKHLNQWLDEQGVKDIDTSDYKKINKMGNEVYNSKFKGVSDEVLAKKYAKELNIDESKAKNLVNMLRQGYKETKVEQNKVKATENLMYDMGLMGAKKQDIKAFTDDVLKGNVTQGRVSKQEEAKLLQDLESKRKGAEGIERKGLNAIIKYVIKDLGANMTEAEFRKRIGMPTGTLADLPVSEARKVYGNAKRVLREELGAYEKYIKSSIERPVNPSYITKSTANKIYNRAIELGYDIEDKEAFTKAIMDADKNATAQGGALDQELSKFYRKHIDTMSDSDIAKAIDMRKEVASSKDTYDKVTGKIVKETSSKKALDDAQYSKSADDFTIKEKDFDTNKDSYDDKNAKEYINKDFYDEQKKLDEELGTKADIVSTDMQSINKGKIQNSASGLVNKYDIDSIKSYLKSKSESKEVAKVIDDMSDSQVKTAYFREFDNNSANNFVPVKQETIDKINAWAKVKENREKIIRNKELLNKLGIPNNTADWSARDMRDFFNVMNARDNVIALKQNDAKLYKEIADMTENFTKVDRASLDYMNSVAYKFKKSTQSNIKSPINTLIKEAGIKVPDNQFNSLTFDTPKGTVKIEEGANVQGISLDDLNGATITLSNSLDDSLQGLNKGNDVLINTNAKNVQGVVRHELNHRLQELYKTEDEITSVSKGIEDTLKDMPSDKQEALINIINSEGVDKSTIDLISQGHLTQNVSFAEDSIQASKETVATYASLIYSKNNATKLGVKNLLGDENYEQFVNNFSNLEPKAFKEVEEFARKTIGDELADNMQKIRDIDNLVSAKNGVEDLTNRMNKAQDISNDLYKAFDLAEDNPQYIQAKENAVKYFEENYPELAKHAEAQFGKYKEIVSISRVMEKFHDTSKLTDAEAKTFDKYVKDMSDMGLKEGIFNEEGADAYMGYVYHMLKGDITETKQIKEYINKMGLDLKDPYNIHAKERKFKGTIEELNNDSQRLIGKKIFEDNIYRMWASRKVNHEKFMYKKNTQDTLIRDFGHEIINDFDPEAMVKSGRISEAELEALKFTKKNEALNKNDMAKYIIEKEGLPVQATIENPNFPTHSPNGMEYRYIPEEQYKNLTEAQVKQARKAGVLYTYQSGEPYITPNYVGAYNDYVYKQAKELGYSYVEKQGIKMSGAGDSKTVPEALDTIKDNIEYSETNLSDMKPSDVKKYLIKTDAFNIYKETMERTFKEDKNAFLKMYDNVMGVFKSQALLSGKFHVNNTIGNIFNSYVTSGTNILSPKFNKKAMDILRGKQGEIGGVSYNDIRTYLTSSGMLNTQVADQVGDLDIESFITSKTDTIKNIGHDVSPIRKTLGKINPFSSKTFVPYQINNKIGDKIETQAKMVNFLTHLDNGFNMAQAEELTQKALFDYSDLTNFESNVMKRIMPFYTYMSKNLGLQLDNIMNNTSRLRPVNALYQDAKQNLESDKDRALKPDYMQNYLPIGNQKYLNLRLPYLDLFTLAEPTDMASGVSPLVKTPIEVLTNKQLYSGGDISKTNNKEEKAKYALQSLLPLAKKIEQFSSDGTVEGDKKSKEAMLSFAGNIKTGFDQAKAQKQTMYQYVTQLQNQYYDLLEKNPGLKEKLAEIQAQEAYNKKQATKNKKEYQGYLNNILKKR